MPLPMTVPTTTAVAWLRRRSRASSGRASVVCGLVAMEGAKSIVENLVILLRQSDDLIEEKDRSSSITSSLRSLRYRLRVLRVNAVGGCADAEPGAQLGSNQNSAHTG